MIHLKWLTLYVIYVLSPQGEKFASNSASHLLPTILTLKVFCTRVACQFIFEDIIFSVLDAGVTGLDTSLYVCSTFVNKI